MVIGGISCLGQIQHWPHVNEENIVAGITACCGAMAYRSAKQRRLGLTLSSSGRKLSERLLLGTVLVPVPFAALVPDGIVHHPWSALLIPLWTIAAYLLVHRAKVEPPVLTLK